MMTSIIDAVYVYATRIAAVVAGIMLRFGLTPPSEPLLARAVLAATITLFAAVVASAYTAATLSRDKRDAVLIVGVCGEGDAASPGKTTLFKTLRSGVPPALSPVTSMEPNEATFAPVARGLDAARSPSARARTAVRWIDFPGHARIRAKLNSYLADARCVVFVVDAPAFTAQARRDAALLHDVLVHPTVQQYATPVLVFCNKSDIPGAAAPDAVRLRLQAELERARISLRAAPAAVAAVDDTDVPMLGFENTPFVFDHAFGPVSFASGSALKKDVMAVVNFVRSSFCNS
eukprot:IDg6533t1